MITLQSSEIDKIIITDSEPTPPTPSTPVDLTPDPEEILNVLNVTFYAYDGSFVDGQTIQIKRSMLGTSIEVSTNVDISDIDSFTLNPSNALTITQSSGNTLSIQIPTNLYTDTDIELTITLALYGR